MKKASKKQTKLIALLLAVMMLVGMLPINVFAETSSGDLGSVHVIVENTTFTSDDAPWTGTLVDTEVALTPEMTMMSAITTALDDAGYEYNNSGGTYISMINGLAEKQNGDQSGWMGTLNDWFTNLGFDNYSVIADTLCAGDVIRVMYSSEGLGTDIGAGKFDSTDTSLSALSIEGGSINETFASGVTEYSVTLDENTTSIKINATATNKNNQVYLFVGNTEYRRTASVPVTAGTEIKVQCGNGDIATVYTLTVNGGSSVEGGDQGGGTYSVEKVKLNKTETAIEVGKTETLIATVTPDNATDATVTWSSSNEDVATVADGVVTAVSAGTATITAKAGDKEATCAVTVKEPIDYSTVDVSATNTFDTLKLAGDGVTVKSSSVRYVETGVNNVTAVVEFVLDANTLDNAAFSITGTASYPVEYNDFGKPKNVYTKAFAADAGSRSFISLFNKASGITLRVLKNTTKSVTNSKNMVLVNGCAVLSDIARGQMQSGTDLSKAVSFIVYIYKENCEKPDITFSPLMAGYSVANTGSENKKISVGTAYELDLSAIFNDIDGDALTYTVKEGEAEAVSTGAEFSKVYNEAGTYTLVFTASDGKSEAVAAYTVTLTVENQPPVLAEDVSATAEASIIVNNSYAVDLSTIFVDTDPLTYTVKEGEAEAVSTGAEFSKVFDKPGTYTLVFTASDGGATTCSYTVKLTVHEGIIIPVEYGVKDPAGSSTIFKLNTITLRGIMIEKFEWVNDVTLNIELPETTADDASFEIIAETSNIFLNVGIDNPTTVQLVEGSATLPIRLTAKAPFAGVDYTITVNFSNEGMSAPVLAEGVEAEVTATVNAGEKYEVDLDKIFYDANGDALTYTVSVDDEEAVAADAKYSFTADVPSDYTLVFKVSDGITNSDATYTVKLTVKKDETKFTSTVKVPDDVTPVFYITKGFRTDDTDKLGDELIAIKGESQNGWTSYTLDIPENVSRISVRGTTDNGAVNWGGMAFEVTKDGTYTLRQVNAIITSKVTVDNVERIPTADEATFVVKYVLGSENCTAISGGSFNYGSFGYLAYRYLLLAADNKLAYVYSAEPLGTLANSYSANAVDSKIVTTDSAKPMNPTMQLGTKAAYTITAPAGATVNMYQQVPGDYYSANLVPAFSTVDNADGTKSYTFNNINSACSYRVSMDGKITKAGYVPDAHLIKPGVNDHITVSWSNSDPAPGYRGAYDSAATNGYSARVEDNILVNVNYRNNLLLDVNETFTLRSYRIWQIINSDTQNIMIEPDFHYNILSGDEYIDLIPAGNTNNAGDNRMIVKGVKEGVAVIEVTYDALSMLGGTSDSGLHLTATPAMVFNAIDPNRTALIVVQVGASDTDINFGIHSNSTKAWDAEHDTLYFIEEKGQIKLTPSSNTSGTITEVEVSNDDGKNYTILTSDNGTYTADIFPGNNVIRVTTDLGNVSYQMVRGAQISYEITEREKDSEGNIVSDGDGFIEPGESVIIAMSGIFTPYNKMSGIYNPWDFHTVYQLNGSTVVGNANAMYGYGSGSVIYWTIPEDATPETVYTLTDGYTKPGTGFGNNGGGHRGITGAVPPSLESNDKLEGVNNIFPDITIKVEVNPVEAVEDIITALGDVTTANALDKAEAIQQAKDAYDNLTDAQKALVTNKSALDDAIQAVKDAEDAKAVEAAIDAIGEITTENVDEKAEEILEAKAAYEALTDEQKALVTNKAKLDAAEAKAGDAKIAKAAENKLDAVTKNVSKEAREALDAYNALSDAQKALVDAEAKDKAAAIEAALADVKAFEKAVEDFADVITSSDMDELVMLENQYEALTEEEKAVVDKDTDAEYDGLFTQAKALNHKSGNVSLIDAPWYIKITTSEIAQPSEAMKKAYDEQEAVFLGDIEIGIYTEDGYFNKETADANVGALLENEAPFTVAFDIAKLASYNNVRVLHEKADGTVEEIKAEVSGTTVTVETEHFSPYAVVGTYNPKTGDNSNVMAALMMFMVAGVICIVATRLNKKVKKVQK